ncbi:MAG: phosphopantothenoylcysteine decarboxylase/phosphopantothenate--cysteine ligase [Moraxellaceae bacterium]|jgi:phosphopantothenoylcysteine decarboxylase/phosphopantothenate--cysteine ligase|nr:phosphopantothenoylcysteine decarboxylase/phosphopantothenate--cysteine ligase [Moraxellaceae bacterium]
MLARLANKRIVLGVSGGIAAYKSAELVRRLRDAGAEVQVVMTPAAQQFITPLTLQALSGNPVHTDLLDPAAEAAMGHIELARWADLVLVAPASADCLARLAQGIANDLLSTLWLATKAQLAVAPAMNQQMWAAPALQANLAVLRARGVAVFGPAAGVQACGDVGEGRMLEAVELAARCADLFETGSLTGRHVVVTAGPTREALDPVRYLSNHSSGKMGFALAAACAEAGARVTLVAGPVHQPTPARVRRVNVTSALEMLAAVEQAVADADVFIATAAVADYRPQQVAGQKIKKSADTFTLELVKNPDIVAAVAARTPRPFVLGFAAETERVLEHARQKLERKRLDMIACNDVARADIGFQSDDNALTVLWSGGEQVLEKASKSLIARQLVQLVAARLAEEDKAPQA